MGRACRPVGHVSRRLLRLGHFHRLDRAADSPWVGCRIGSRAGRQFATLRVCVGLGIVGAILLPLIARERRRSCSSCSFDLGRLRHQPSSDRAQRSSATGLHRAPISSNANAALVIVIRRRRVRSDWIVGGAAMDVWNPHGIMAVLTAMFAVLLVTTLWRGVKCRRHQPAQRKQRDDGVAETAKIVVERADPSSRIAPSRPSRPPTSLSASMPPISRRDHYRTRR